MEQMVVEVEVEEGEVGVGCGEGVVLEVTAVTSGGRQQ